MRTWAFVKLFNLRLVHFGIVALFLSAGVSAPAESVPHYSIGSVIPPQTVRAGSVLHFVIDIPSGSQQSRLTTSISPKPQGEINFDAKSHEFTFAPNQADHQEFAVAFNLVATNGNVLATSRVPIIPIPTATSQFKTLFSEGPTPPIGGTEYITIEEKPRTVKELFNNEQRALVDVTVIGNEVTFDRSADQNGLVARFEGRKDIKTLLITADTLIIRTAWHLPQASVQIYARRLIFEDKAPTREGVSPACIDVTPASDWNPAAPADENRVAENGADGHSGGEILLSIREFSAPPKMKRLIARGGNGQNGGQGKNGDAGTVHLAEPGQSKWEGFPSPAGIPGHTFPPGTVYVELQSDLASGIGGYKKWPDNGKPAKPAGKPGEPGNGGRITSTVAGLDEFIELGGGASGTPGTLAIGGEPGTPKDAKWVYFRAWNVPDIIFAQQHAVKGADAPPPQPNALKGRDGTIVVDRSNSLAWAHPFLLDAVVNYGKDLYLNGHLQEARQWFQIYMQCLEKDAESVPELLPAVAIRKVEIASLLQRLSANLDYFSNPAGWTPMLSFEISLTAFRRQVDTAIPIMFTKYWLSRRSDDITAKAQALTEATDQLTALVKKDRDTLAGLQQNLVTLHDEARAISQEMKDIQDDLKKKEQELERRAQANVEERNRLPFWKQGLRTLGAVCSVMPVYQPVLGSIGTGLSILSNIDTAQPLDTIKGLASVSDGFTDDALKKSCEDLNDITSQFDLSKPVSLREKINKLAPVASRVATAVSAIQKATESAQAPKSEIDAELSRLKSEDPEFNDLIQRLESLNIRKSAFHELIEKAAQQISTVTESIGINILTIDSMLRERSASVAKLRPEVQLYLNDLDRRARESLLQYHYYLAKAYEYRVLKPYKERLNLDRIYDRFQELLGDKDHGVRLTQDETNQLGIIFQGILSNITQNVMVEFNTNRPKRSGEIVYDLSEQGLEILNRTNHLVIDLNKEGYLNAEEENIRLVTMKVAEVELTQVAGPKVTPTTTITFEHSLVSQIRSNGSLWLFRHPSPISWGANVAGVGKGPLVKQQTFSPSDETLLVSLLAPKSGELDPEKVLFFSRPAAWGEIYVHKSVVPNSVQTSVDRLKLTLVYEFSDVPTNQVVLQLKPTGNVAPYVEISGATTDITDTNGLSGGSGELFRMFSRGTKLRFNVPQRIGRYTFSEWRLNSDDGTIISQNPAFEYTLKESTNLIPVYKLASPSIK